MITEELGKGNEKTIVMLHGANFVHTFGMQYRLADSYHIIVPHIMGYGNHTDKIFDTDSCINELAEFISGLNKKVLLVGFSLGAQLAFRLVSEHPELFTGAVIVSPWLIKEEPMLSEVMKMNEKQFASFKKRWLCNIIGMMNGLPSAQRKEFVEQMQKVSIKTVHNSVNNGITFDTVSFADVSIPVIALAGAKEQKEVTDSVKKMAELNDNCRFEIWDKAAHNIPVLFSKRFNELLCSMLS
ncbi:MAG: alpha/beta hydrolase [Oscillospiraceae bacterium]|nr:alpha/beta hydrolase [Oscillospiraceae bacterium]